MGYRNLAAYHDDTPDNWKEALDNFELARDNGADEAYHCWLPLWVGVAHKNLGEDSEAIANFRDAVADPEASSDCFSTAKAEWASIYATTTPNGLKIYWPFEMELVQVPGGDFLMGSDPSKDSQAQGDEQPQYLVDEQPQHEVTVSEFYIGGHEVTNEQWAVFVQATGYTVPGHVESNVVPTDKGNHPVIKVNWEDAKAFTHWLSEETDVDFRLCTEAEWEKACRGNDNTIYPWGDTWDATDAFKANIHETGVATTMQVGHYSPQGDTPKGVADLAGNVWEWCNSEYKKYPYDAEDGREGIDKGSASRVLRGGSFATGAADTRCASRTGGRSVGDDTVGFRMCLSFSCTDLSDPSRAGCEALVALYENTEGANWVNDGGWLKPFTSPCSWYGVTCDDDNKVTKIDLSENELVGELPPELVVLTGLEELHLNSNTLSGGIPTWLPDLPNLKSLNLSKNPIGGQIPASIGELSSLEKLWLDVTELEGSIPPEIGELRQLEKLAISRNNLVGEIPSSFGNLTKLTELYLYDNKGLTGTIPEELENLPDLQVLWLNGNQLEGTFPVPIDNFGDMRSLNLSNISLEGPIPTELCSLTELTELQLEDTQLTGAIPLCLTELTKLQKLRLKNNNLTGGIPPWLATLPELTHLSLTGNPELDDTIPEALFKVNSLRELHLRAVGLSGNIPQHISDLNQLKTLDLSGNQFSGQIPPELGLLTNLQRLYLYDNKLEGQIPSELCDLTDLEELEIHNNQLTGPIPSCLAGLTKLRELDQGRNSLVASDVKLIKFLDTEDPDWKESQTPTEVTVTTETWINPKDEAVYILIPAGKFLMGSNEDAPGLDVDDDELFQHTIHLDDYWIMQTVVSNAQYAACVDDGACKPSSRPNWRSNESAIVYR